MLECALSASWSRLCPDLDVRSQVQAQLGSVSSGFRLCTDGASRRWREARVYRYSSSADGRSVERGPQVEIYLPIADLPVNVLVILAMGLAVGFISGMFGIGGGFLMTPLLIFLGISPAVAVASVTGHIAASSMSGAISYWRRRAIDIALCFMLLAGGIIGTAVGVWLFTFLRALGQLDITIGVSYVLLLSIVGALMVAESIRAIVRVRQGKPVDLRRPGSNLWIMACRSSCASSAPVSTSPRFRYSASAALSALSAPSWGSGAGSCWCRC